MELFYFNKELMPFYLWALGGILLCIFALFKVNSNKESSQEDSALRSENNILFHRLLFGIIIYLLCGISVVGFMMSSVPLSIYGCIFIIFVLAMIFNFSKK